MEINYQSVTQSTASVKVSVQSGTRRPSAQEDTGKTASGGQDVYVPSKELVRSANDAGVIEQMKASLNSAQAKLFDTVNDLLSRQGIQVRLGQGAWKTAFEGDFKVDAETQAAAKQAISEDGEWGVKKTSERLVSFAKALVGGDKSKIEMMRDAFIKGYQAAEKAWGGKLPEISQQTYDATMKLFDEWAKEGEEGAAASSGEDQAPVRGGGTTISFEYEYTQTSSASLSLSTGKGADAEALEQSGLLSNVSDPLKVDGITLNSSWSMNEKVSVTVTIGGGSQGASRAEPGRDGFVSRPDNDFGGYDRGGKRTGGHRGERPERPGREMTLTFIKPMSLDSGKQQGSLRVGGMDIPFHEDGTVTVGLPDGTLRRANVDQEALDRAVQNSRA